MHVLTKVFIVLNSILAVLLVPLVVVYAHNENSYKGQLRTAQGSAQAAKATLDSATKSYTARDAMQEVQAERLRGQISKYTTELNGANREIDGLRNAMTARSTDEAGRAAEVRRLSAGYETAMNITSQLMRETAGLRDEALAAQEETLKLTQDLRDAERQLEVIDGARRRLEEQLADLRTENSTALRTIQTYRQVYPNLDQVVGVTAISGIPDTDLLGTVLNVREDDSATYVEINLGSKDGVKEGWKLIISDGVNFITDIKITKVDISTSIGMVASADRRKVSIGNRVRAVKGH